MYIFMYFFYLLVSLSSASFSSRIVSASNLEESWLGDTFSDRSEQEEGTATAASELGAEKLRQESPNLFGGKTGDCFGDSSSSSSMCLIFSS